MEIRGHLFAMTDGKEKEETVIRTKHRSQVCLWQLLHLKMDGLFS